MFVANINSRRTSGQARYNGRLIELRQFYHYSVSQDEVPKFMGMPLYGLQGKSEEKLKEDLTEEEVFYLNGLGARRTSMTSMNNMDRLRGRSSGTDLKNTGRNRSRSASRINSKDGISKNRLNHINPIHFQHKYLQFIYYSLFVIVLFH